MTPVITYPVVIDYSPEDGGFVARVRALKYCTAFGHTYEEAGREIESAIEGWIETAKARGTPIPPPIDSNDLKAAADVLNLTALARAAGIPAQTLFATLRRGTALKPAQARAIAKALNEVGLDLVAKAG